MHQVEFEHIYVFRYIIFLTLVVSGDTVERGRRLITLESELIGAIRVRATDLHNAPEHGDTASHCSTMYDRAVASTSYIKV